MNDTITTSFGGGWYLTGEQLKCHAKYAITNSTHPVCLSWSVSKKCLVGQLNVNWFTSDFTCRPMPHWGKHFEKYFLRDFKNKFNTFVLRSMVSFFVSVLRTHYRGKTNMLYHIKKSLTSKHLNQFLTWSKKPGRVFFFLMIKTSRIYCALVGRYCLNCRLFLGKPLNGQFNVSGATERSADSASTILILFRLTTPWYKGFSCLSGESS